MCTLLWHQRNQLPMDAATHSSQRGSVAGLTLTQISLGQHQLQQGLSLHILFETPLLLLGCYKWTLVWSISEETPAEGPLIAVRGLTTPPDLHTGSKTVISCSFSPESLSGSAGWDHFSQLLSTKLSVELGFLCQLSPSPRYKSEQAQSHRSESVSCGVSVEIFLPKGQLSLIRDSILE